MTREALSQQPNPQEIPGITGEYRLLSDPGEIIRVWGEEIDKASEGEKVWLRTMHLRDGEAMSKLAPKLISAAQRDADVRMLYDPISYLESKGLPSYAKHFPIPRREVLADEYRKNRALHQELTEGGVQMLQTRPETPARQVFPYKGADHIKGTRIRDRFWFGDKNLEQASFSDMKGFVIEIPNPEIIERLTEIIGSTQSPDFDEIIPIESDPDTQIIQDAGHPGVSRIYKTALEIVGQANGFVGTSTQFYPEGRYFQALKDTKARGSVVEPITSSPSFFGLSPYAAVNDISGKLIRWDGVVPVDPQPELAIGQSVEMTGVLKFLYSHRGTLIEGFRREAANGFRGNERTGDFRMAFVKEGVHAKYVVTENEVYFGTNNLSEWGIRAGTAELGIHSTNPQLVSAVRAYHDSLFQSTLDEMATRRSERRSR